MKEAIRTDRLALRVLRREDAPFVLEGLNDLSVARWLSVVPYPYAQTDFDQFFGHARPGEFWVIEEAGAFCGGVALGAGGKLGYWLLPRAHGRGIMTEAAGAVLAEHFAGGGGAVSSGYFEGNAPSAAVLRKLGFAEISREMLFCRPLGQDRSHVSVRLEPPPKG